MKLSSTLHRWVVVLLLMAAPLAASPTSELFVSEQGQLTEPLVELLALTGIHHDGTLTSVVRETQKWWLRPKGAERWDLDDNNWQLEHRDQVIALCQKLGCIDAVVSNRAQATYAAWLGANYLGARERLMTLVQAWEAGERFSQVVVLTGERYLRPEAEGPEQLYSPSPNFLIRNDWQAPNVPPKTETEMMLLTWDQAVMPNDMRQVELVVIDAPRGNKARPNTEDTYIAWLKTKPKPGSIVALSNQPFVGYQQLVGEGVVPNNFSLETIGAQAPSEIRVSILLDNLARCLYQIQKNGV